MQETMRLTFYDEKQKKCIHLVLNDIGHMYIVKGKVPIEIAGFEIYDLLSNYYDEQTK